MGKYQVLVCYVGGSIYQNSRDLFEPVVLFLACAG